MPDRRSHLSRPARNGGYSLIELSVVLAILSLVSGMALSVTTAKTERAKLVELNKSFDTLETALESYATRNSGLLPCPARGTQAEATADFGRASTQWTAASNCYSDTATWGSNATITIAEGVVPVRTLGLPDRAMYDPWGSRINYLVVKEMTNSGTQTTTLNTIVIRDSTTGALPGALPNGAMNPLSTTAVPYQAANNSMIVRYVLMSSGPDKFGGYNRKGTQAACSTGTLETMNCPPASLATTSPLVRDMVISQTRLNSSASYFNDYLRWKAYR